MADKAKEKGGNLITPPAILSYAYIYKAQEPQNEGEKAKFGCTLVFVPEAQKDPRFKALKVEALRVARAAWGAEADEMIRAGKLNWPFLSGDPQYPEGSVFIRPRSESRPGVVGTQIDPLTGKLEEIGDDGRLYSGCHVLASVSCYKYDKKMNKGVTFGLGNLQKLRDGERLDGRTKAVDDFSPVEAVDDAALAGLI